MKKIRNARQRSRFASSTYELLEEKNLLAAIYHNPDTGVLYIAGDSGNNVGQVSGTDGTIAAQIDGESYSGSSSEIIDIVFIGYDGNDRFTNQSDRSVTMYGHLGSDTLIGGSGDDILVGGSGNDTIQGGAGNDRIVGADGNDNLDGGEGDDRIFGTAGVNTIFGGDGDDVIYGSEDEDEIHGDAGADKIYALGGDDVLYTGAGGTEGGSFAEGDLAMGHGGDDTFYGTSGLDIFYGGDGDDIMEGGDGENRMHGQGGNDDLTGGDAGDYMTGADGDDTFDGRGGIDFYNVGDGSDTIVYSTLEYSPSEVRIENNSGSVETRIQNELVSGASWIQFADRTISANQASNSTQDEAGFWRLNGYRVSNSEGFLSKPSDLAAYALEWSQQMALQGRESNSSLGDQRSLLTGDRTVVGEIVGSVADTGQSAIEIVSYFHNEWQSDTSDNAVMLRSDFLEVGVSILKSGGMWWATQIYTG